MKRYKFSSWKKMSVEDRILYACKISFDEVWMTMEDRNEEQRQIKEICKSLGIKKLKEVCTWDNNIKGFVLLANKNKKYIP